MTEFHKAWMVFWQQFGVPVFLAGCVDDQTAFPYITVNIADGDLLGQNILVTNTWHRRSAVDSWTPSMKERLDLLDEIKTAIPTGGLLLNFPGGYAILRRNDTNFISYVVDDTDPNVIGGRVSYEVQYFHL